MITAINYGAPPCDRSYWRAALAQARNIDAERLEQYADTLLRFQEWCEARELNFRHGVMQALALFQQLMENGNGSTDRGGSGVDCQGSPPHHPAPD